MDTELHYALLRTLSYFQVFQYPLTAREAWKFLPVKCKIQHVENGLEYLTGIGSVFRFDQYYSLHDDISLVLRRKTGNALGQKKLKKAYRIARFLGLFPFVEAVFISGSLSKDFALADSDLDFFIATTPGRLWIARNLMHLFRKLTFAFNAQDSFCMNYYISLTQPNIYPRNYYTAVEFSTLKAACVHEGLEDLISANESWISVQLPNMALNTKPPGNPRRKAIITVFAEALIDMLGGDTIESWLYKTTMQRWERKWNKMGYDVYKCMLSAGPHVNTPVNYPVHLPDKILRTWEDIFQDASLKYKSLQMPLRAARA